MQRRTMIMSSLATLTGWSFSTANAQKSPSQGTWSSLNDMPFPVQEIYPTLFIRNGKPLIVNAGGLAVALGRPIKSACTIYDPATDEWSRGVDLPETRHHVALTHVPDIGIFAIGGFKRQGLDIWAAQSQVWRIADPTSGQWEEARPLPVPRAEAVTLHKDGQIHMIGGRSPGPANEGWSDQRDTGFHHIYDPQADKWEEAAPMPVPRNSSTGAVIGNTIYIVSGRTVKSGNTPLCHAYDTATDAWREVAPLPVPERQSAPHGQGGLAGGAFNGKLYAFGGEWFKGQLSPDDEGGVYADTWEYNPVTDTWRPVAEMIRPRHGLGGVSIEGFGSVDGMYAIGGAARPSGSGVTPHLDRFVI